MEEAVFAAGYATSDAGLFSSVGCECNRRPEAVGGPLWLPEGSTTRLRLIGRATEVA
jgi:hypothetical protein